MAIVYWSYDIVIYVMDATFQSCSLQAGSRFRRDAIFFIPPKGPKWSDARESAALKRNQYRVAMTADRDISKVVIVKTVDNPAIVENFLRGFNAVDNWKKVNLWIHSYYY